MVVCLKDFGYSANELGMRVASTQIMIGEVSDGRSQHCFLDYGGGLADCRCLDSVGVAQASSTEEKALKVEIEDRGIWVV